MRPIRDSLVGVIEGVKGCLPEIVASV
jgi:hypothetical protein